MKNRLQASYGHIYPAFRDFHSAYLRHFDAAPSIDDGYVDNAGLVAYTAAVEHQFGLVCDLAGVPGHLFPEGMTSPKGDMRRMGNDEEAIR